MCWQSIWGWKGGEKRNLISPLSVWSLVSAVATRCQESWMTETGGGMVRWHCPQRPSSSPSGHPLTAGYKELRRRTREEKGREMSDGDTSSIQTWDKRQMLRIGSKKRAGIGNWDGRRSERCDPESQSLSDRCWDMSHPDTEERWNGDSFYRK